MSKIATIIGATGLIGGCLLDQLLEDPYYDTVRILIRRPSEKMHPKLEKKIVDFNDGDSMLVAMEGSNALFCAVGTTNKKVRGNKEAYRKVDFDIPVNAARYCSIIGCNIFVLVSSVGANASSGNFYLKLKGEVEEVIKKMLPGSVHVMRPSVLLGERKEFRLGELIGKRISVAISFLLPSKYRPVNGATVAAAMIEASKINTPGFFIYENIGIKKLSAGAKQDPHQAP